MIWHHNGDSQIKLLSVVVQAGFEHDGACSLRKNPTSIGTECYEMLLVVALKMRKLSAVKSLRHKVLCGDSPRLSGGAKLRSLEV